MLLSHSIVGFLAYFVEKNFYSRQNLDKLGKFLVDQFCIYIFKVFLLLLYPFLLVKLSCSVCVLLQGKRSSASRVSVKFLMVQVIHFQDLGFFCNFHSFFYFLFFNFSLHLEEMIVIHFSFTSGRSFAWPLCTIFRLTFSYCSCFHVCRLTCLVS